MQRVIFEQPEDMSPLAADLHRWWYERLGVRDRRLVVDSFILMEPYWTLRTRSAPFWMVFNTEFSLRALEAYLEHTPAEEIYLTLFSHGVDSIGLAPIAEWRRILRRASRRAAFLGVDERAFPRDFAVFARYHFDVIRQIQYREPLPSPLTLGDLDRFVSETKGQYRVEWR